jgi:hypothetical protein
MLGKIPELECQRHQFLIGFFAPRRLQGHFGNRGKPDNLDNLSNRGVLGNQGNRRFSNMKRRNATDKIVPVVLNIDEHTRLKVAAAQARTTLSEFIHGRLFGPAPAATARPERTVEHHEAPSPSPDRGGTVTPQPEHEALHPLLADAFGGRPPPIPVPMPNPPR